MVVEGALLKLYGVNQFWGVSEAAGNERGKLPDLLKLVTFCFFHILV